MLLFNLFVTICYYMLLHVTICYYMIMLLMVTYKPNLTTSPVWIPRKFRPSRQVLCDHEIQWNAGDSRVNCFIMWFGTRCRRLRMLHRRATIFCRKFGVRKSQWSSFLNQLPCCSASTTIVAWIPHAFRELSGELGRAQSCRMNSLIRDLGRNIETWKPPMMITLWLCQNSYWKSPFLMGKSTISMAIFNSYFDITRGYFFDLLCSFNPLS